MHSKGHNIITLVFLSERHKFILNMRKHHMNTNLRDILQNKRLVFFKSVKVMKDKER